LAVGGHEVDGGGCRPEQLGPVIQSSVTSHAGLAMSLLERCTSMYM
jgi:hypothetical protein